MSNQHENNEESTRKLNMQHSGEQQLVLEDGGLAYQKSAEKIYQYGRGNPLPIIDSVSHTDNDKES